MLAAHPTDLPRVYRVQAKAREPLLRWILDALTTSGCRVIHASPANEAPFRVAFMLPNGERMGIVAYAFLANSRVTRNRPGDEHRFQVKYGTKDGKRHELWQDPFGLYTTLFLGINPERGLFVGADPVLHSPTRLFISIEFKEEHALTIERRGWHSWERDRRAHDDRVEILVGGSSHAFLRYVMFEREALGEEQGHRQLLAERAAPTVGSRDARGAGRYEANLSLSPERLHALALEFEMSESEVLDLVATTPHVKKAVRGTVAEEHLVRALASLPGVSAAHRVMDAAEVDVSVRLHGGRPLRIQCKNVLRRPTHDGLARLDFQRTRAARADPCSRYYSPRDFDVVAACLHAVSERWTFKFALPGALDPHAKCVGKLASNVRIDSRWSEDARDVLARVG